MGYRIAVGGKGGVGKTTLSALIVRSLLKKEKTPLLVVDADPNTNLPEAIGLPYDATVGSILADFIDTKITIPAGMTKEAFLQIKMHGAISESKGMDLLVMGRGEGPGCYCYPNVMLRGFIEELSGNYPYTIIDNEAGMEHLSRRTEDRIDQMILVSDPSIRGVRSAGRINELIKELKLNVGKVSLVIARCPDSLPAALEEEVQSCGVTLVGTVPADELIAEYDLAQRSLLDLPDSSPAVAACGQILQILQIME